MENNNTSPSINTLQTIANYLEVPLAYLLLENHQHMQVIKKDQRRLLTNELESFKTEYLGSISGLKLLKVELPVGAELNKPHAHEGAECHFVLKGKIYVQQGEDSEVLEEGDSFSWNACVAHFVKNVGDETAHIIISAYSNAI